MEQIKYSVEICNAIALCHIIDKFENFEKELIRVISPKYNRNFVYQLWDVSKGKLKLGAKKASKFYKENKEVIDTINKYSNIPTFINFNYGFTGEPNTDFQVFYRYVFKHKDEIKRILSILEKLKELAFSSFEFNENLDFTKDIYDMDTIFNKNININFVANIEVLPNYDSYIKYKTSNSNYKMKLNIDIFNRNFSMYDKKIELNSLLFNSEDLPSKIDKENIFDHLINLKQQESKRCSVIKNSIDLSISIEDLDKQFNSTFKTINSLIEIDKKEELIKTLLSAKEYLENLKITSEEYIKKLCQEEPSVTQEILENEKSLYLRKR